MGWKNPDINPDATRTQPGRNPDATRTLCLQRDAFVGLQPDSVVARGTILDDRGDNVFQPPEEHVAWSSRHALALGELFERRVQGVLPHIILRISDEVPGNEHRYMNV